MPNASKLVLWGVGILVLLTAGVVLSSNLAQLLHGSYDGKFQTLAVFSMLTGEDSRGVTAARLSLLIVGGLVVFAAGGIWNKTRRQTLFGEARWATESEIRKNNLRSKRGLIVGRFKGKFLIFGGSEHVFVSAPTRGGKGVGIVIPNLLNWPDSTIVLDVKKENWELTSGFRKAAGQAVYLFDPLDPEGRTARYNPLGYVNRATTDDLYDDLQRIATMLLPTDSRTADPFWTNSARTAFIAIAGYVAETNELPFTLGEVLRQFNTSNKISQHFMDIATERESTRPLSRQCRTAMNDFLSGSDKTVQSIRSTVTAKLNLWLNGRIDAATSANDFDLRDLRRKPISIYLGVTPDNLERLAPLLNLFFQQAVDLNSRSLPEHDKGMDRQVMLMMDEFRTLGNVEVISKGVAFLAGYGFRIVTIVQSPAQLRAVYGPDEAANYITNHGVEVIFTPKDHAVAKELSERFGNDTVSRKSRSRGIGLAKSNRTESTSDDRRPLMLPQELVLTPYEEEYVLKAGMPPIKAEKILYFKEAVFKKRVLPAPEVEPAKPASDARQDTLKRRVQALRMSQAEPIVRSATVEEITASEQPADGDDGRRWDMVEGEGIEREFADLPPIDMANPEAHRAGAESAINKFLARIGYDTEEAARSVEREDRALAQERAAAALVHDDGGNAAGLNPLEADDEDNILGTISLVGDALTMNDEAGASHEADKEDGQKAADDPAQSNTQPHSDQAKPQNDSSVLGMISLVGNALASDSNPAPSEPSEKPVRKRTPAKPKAPKAAATVAAEPPRKKPVRRKLAASGTGAESDPKPSA